MCDLAQALSAQGRYREAHALLDAQSAATGTAADPRNERLLQATHLAVYVAEGDVEHALALAPSAAVAPPAPADANEAQVLAGARALMLAGWNADARTLMEQASTAWPGAGRPTASRARILRTLAQARLAAGDAAAARATASTLAGLFEGQHATASSGWRDANEILALACARLGDDPAARRALDAARAVRARFGSAVEGAESALNRAEVAVALGQRAEAKSLAQAALAGLEGQSPTSPRLAQAHRLAALPV